MAVFELLNEALQNLWLRKSRTVLAAMGIIFGVASVICMLSISEVARQDVVGRIERLGLNNIILDSVKPEAVRGRNRAANEGSYLDQYGITKKDLQILSNNLSQLDEIVPMRIMLKNVTGNGRRTDVTVVGTSQNYATVMDQNIARGRFFTAIDENHLKSVCVLGYDSAKKIFPLKSPINEVIKIGNQFFTVIGVLEKKGVVGVSGQFADPDNSAFIPFTTTFAKFGGFQYRRNGNAQEITRVEVDRAIIKVRDDRTLGPIAQAANNMLKRLHKKSDVAVTIPFHLLAEKEESERIFRWVMGSLAAISLLVGGIGIMNIMLANVAERRSEIGLRRAIGATQSDILSLFVSESLVLCFFGGLIGIAVGVGLANIIGTLADWVVVYHVWSIPLGLLVSIVVGLIFGTAPAIKAAKEDPVMALRSE